jgi:HEAT repeat protein
MDVALVFVTSAIAALGGAVLLFLAVLALHRLGQVSWAGRMSRARDRCAQLVAQILADELPGDDPAHNMRPGTPPWRALEALLSEARKEAREAGDDEAVARVDRFLWNAGFSNHYLYLLAHGSRWERATAAARLAEHRHPKATEALIAAVNDPDRDVRTVAVRSLGELGDPAALQVLADTLAGAMSGGSELSHRVVAASLARFGPQVADALAPHLSHPSWRVRGAVAMILGEVGAQGYAEPLLERLGDPEPDVRAKAAQALGRIGAEGALFPLLGRLEDASWLVRMQAVRALGKTADPAAVGAVSRRLTDAHWRVRQEAAIALGKMGDGAIEVLTRTLVRTDDHYARDQVVEELQRTRVIADAIEQMGDGDDDPARTLLAAVLQAGAVSPLLSALESHPDAAVRRRLVELLAGHAHPRIDGALSRVAAKDADPMVRAEAERQLALRAPQGEVA